jgi:hypothetical protein
MVAMRSTNDAGMRRSERASRTSNTKTAKKMTKAAKPTKSAPLAGEGKKPPMAPDKREIAAMLQAAERLRDQRGQGCAGEIKTRPGSTGQDRPGYWSTMACEPNYRKYGTNE